jgi:hypothetical protein
MAEKTKEFNEGSGQFWLWTGLLLPPIAWSMQIEVVYLLSDYACKTQNFLPNHLASAVALIVSLAGLGIAWRNLKQAGDKWPSDHAGPIPRSRFMAVLGLMSGALFSLVIIAQWLPTIVGVPCGK